jgi:hypothetical protein
MSCPVDFSRSVHDSPRSAAAPCSDDGRPRLAWRRIAPVGRQSQNESVPRAKMTSASKRGSACSLQLPFGFRARTPQARTPLANVPDAWRNLRVPPWILFVCLRRAVNAQVCRSTENSGAWFVEVKRRKPRATQRTPRGQRRVLRAFMYRLSGWGQGNSSRTTRCSGSTIPSNWPCGQRFPAEEAVLRRLARSSVPRQPTIEANGIVD